MAAVAATLAAFRPDTKRFLARSGTLMPAVQMIMRACGKHLAQPEDYLGGAAHPIVFQSANLDAEAMVRMAHDMPSNSVPPVVQLEVVEEDHPVAGRDYFDLPAGDREKLFDTPCAIARVCRSTRSTSAAWSSAPRAAAT